MGELSMEPRMTVLAAAFNGRSYIEQQMDSILAQSRKGILLVVSDDCSTDGTGALLDAYERAHEGQVLALHRREPSGGAAAHFLSLLKCMAELKDSSAGSSSAAGFWETDEDRRAVTTGEMEMAPAWMDIYGMEEKTLTALEDAAQADYFLLSDQDDVWLPIKAEKLLLKMRELERSTPDRGETTPLLVHSDLKVVDEELKEIAPSFFKYQKISPERTGLAQLLVQNNVTGGAVMINKAMLPYLERLPRVCLMHDAWMGLVAACFGKLGWVDEPLYLYRQHRRNVLGAEKGDSLNSAVNRMKDNSAAAQNYRLMFGQAESLLELFGARLDEEQKEILEAFAALRGQSRIGKAASILKYGFTKNTWLRTLGQILFIGD